MTSRGVHDAGTSFTKKAKSSGNVGGERATLLFHAVFQTALEDAIVSFTVLINHKYFIIIP